ncbi:hypothetical protein CY35_02G190300 [Sphagnum magellanicum]|nr:hypothetical protein CY35_02G190300 [Sphagnum magellanicum]
MAAASPAATNQNANSDLLEAVRCGDESKVAAALAQQDVDVNCLDEGYCRHTPLLLACNPKAGKANRSVVHVLLADSKVDVNAHDIQGQTALHSCQDDEELLEEILLSERTEIDWNAADKIDQTPLLWFARTGRAESVGRLIGVESVNLFATTIDGFTALHQVAELKSPFPAWVARKDISNRCNIVRLVLEEVRRRAELVLEEVGRRADEVLVDFVNATDILNRSALHYIAEEGCIEILEVLCEFSANMNVIGVDFHGFTPLHLAVRNGHDAVVERLLQLQSIYANVRATVNASNPDKLKPFEEPQSWICRPNLFLEIPEAPSRDLTPLHFAVMDGRIKVVRLLLEWEGINIDAEDSEGLTPLHYSVQNRHWEIAELLLKKGKPFATLNINTVDWEGKTPLHLAVPCGRMEVVRLLLECEGININAMDRHGRTPLHLAIIFTQMEIVRLLLESEGINIHAEDSKGETPFQYSVDIGHIEMVELLLKKGKPDYDRQCGVFQKLLCLATKRGHVETVQEVLEYPKLDVNAQDNDKMTPLLYAIKAGDVDMVKVLCQKDKFHRLRATEENWAGHTPLQIVVEENNRSEHSKLKAIEQVLLERPEVKDFVDRLYRDRQVFVDAANALLVGAALIASVTFAGWLQPPLGYTPYYDFSQPSPAPPGAYESYAAIKQNPKVKAFWVFNSLSFFFAIATVLAGADAAMPSLDDAFIGRVVKSVRTSLILASVLLVMSVVCVLGAFASGGLAVLPPVLKYDTSMIITVCVGGTVCMIILAKFLRKLAKAIHIRVQRRKKPDMLVGVDHQLV